MVVAISKARIQWEKNHDSWHNASVYLEYVRANANFDFYERSELLLCMAASTVGAALELGEPGDPTI